MAVIFAAVEPLTPAVAHMMPFLIGRFVAGDFSSAAKRCGPVAVSASTAPPAFRKSRRVNEYFMAKNRMRLNQLGESRHGQRSDLEFHFPIEFLRNELLLGVDGFIPG